MIHPGTLKFPIEETGGKSALANVTAFTAPTCARANVTAPRSAELPLVIDHAGGKGNGTTSALIQGDFKLITGMQLLSFYQGPAFPNSSGYGRITKNRHLCVPGCLYNLTADPTEQNNIAFDEIGIVKAMHTRIAELAASKALGTEGTDHLPSLCAALGVADIAAARQMREIMRLTVGGAPSGTPSLEKAEAGADSPATITAALGAVSPAPGVAGAKDHLETVRRRALGRCLPLRRRVREVHVRRERERVAQHARHHALEERAHERAAEEVPKVEHDLAHVAPDESCQ